MGRRRWRGESIIGIHGVECGRYRMSSREEPLREGMSAPRPTDPCELRKVSAISSVVGKGARSGLLEFCLQETELCFRGCKTTKGVDRGPQEATRAGSCVERSVFDSE